MDEVVSRSEGRDLIMCTLSSDELAIVDWDLGGCSYFEDAIDWKPGLRVARLWAHGNGTNDILSLSRFVKASREYTRCKFTLI